MRQNTKPESVWILKTTGEAVRAEDAPFTLYEDTGYELSLKWAKEHIANGCTIAELVRLPYGEMWMDEEGLFREERHLNGMATAIYQSVMGGGNPIVGNVVLVLYPGHAMESNLNKVLGELVRN